MGLDIGMGTVAWEMVQVEGDNAWLMCVCSAVMGD
jgi:hypothetical protein